MAGARRACQGNPLAATAPALAKPSAENTGRSSKLRAPRKFTPDHEETQPRLFRRKNATLKQRCCRRSRSCQRMEPSPGAPRNEVSRPRGVRSRSGSYGRGRLGSAKIRGPIAASEALLSLPQLKPTPGGEAPRQRKHSRPRLTRTPRALGLRTPPLLTTLGGRDGSGEPGAQSGVSWAVAEPEP